MFYTNITNYRVMITTVTNYGDNLGVQFPKSMGKNIHISENDNVEIWIKNDAIIIKRQADKKHLTTKERVAAFYDNTTEDYQPSETEWGKPRGKEIW